MRRWHKLAFAVMAWTAAIGAAAAATAQTKPEGEMRFALYVTVPPAWLDPAEAAPGFTSPFWVLYALHDALVKPMPGQRMAPSLAESWTESSDKLSYEFKLRQGVKFHNGDPFTANDVVFSFARAKGEELHQKVKEVVAVDPYTVRFALREPWPDFMTFYGTLASAASWITPKKYFEQVGPDGFKKHPIGLGPYKFASTEPGIEIVMEANEDYWRKVLREPSTREVSIAETTWRSASSTVGFGPCRAANTGLAARRRRRGDRGPHPGAHS
jgi:peptide/nickel transport system substrate-binding protein